jgi:hypothetical protein
MFMTEDQFKRTLNAELANFFGKQTRHFDERFNALETKAGKRFDELANIVDGIAKRLDDNSAEQVITNDRHENWIKQLADSTDTKLVPEP